MAKFQVFGVGGSTMGDPIDGDELVHQLGQEDVQIWKKNRAGDSELIAVLRLEKNFIVKKISD